MSQLDRVLYAVDRGYTTQDAAACYLQVPRAEVRDAVAKLQDLGLLVLEEATGDMSLTQAGAERSKRHQARVKAAVESLFGMGPSGEGAP